MKKESDEEQKKRKNVYNKQIRKWVQNRIENVNENEVKENK